MAADPKKVNRALEYLQSHTVQVGILGIGGNIPGKGESRKEITVLEYGIYQEFGTSKIPARPFFSHALTSNRSDIQNYIEKLLNDILLGKLDGMPACIKLGLYLQGLVMQSIATANQWARPLSPKTVAIKSKKAPNRVNQPLIMDGFLIKSIRFQIIKSGSSVYKSDWAKFNV